MPTISNDQLTIEVANKGAELQSIYHKHHSLEYMWSADPAYWAKKSPVLFPIVGGLRNGTYSCNGQTYTMPRHGFARDMPFELSAQTENSLSFSLASNRDTMQVYPYNFLFTITYTLHENTLQVAFAVKNTSVHRMYFSVGAHPAFAVPLVIGTAYEDYYLQFEKKETAGRWPLSADGLVELAPFTLLKEESMLPLTKELFKNDALVFKHLRSESVSLLSHKTNHGLKVSYHGFPYLGIWAARGADFVCIEPWCGIADSVNASGNLREKEGIHPLEAGQEFERKYSIEVF